MRRIELERKKDVEKVAEDRDLPREDGEREEAEREKAVAKAIIGREAFVLPTRYDHFSTRGRSAYTTLFAERATGSPNRSIH